MSVWFEERTKEFHLYNDSISYIFKVLENGSLGHIYFGKRLRPRAEFGHLIEFPRRDMAPNVYEGNHRFSMEHLKQEYPTYGSGDMRYPAFELEQQDGSRVVDFKYREHRIFKGKKKLKELPAIYTEQDDEAETLEVIMEDKMLQMEMILRYVIFRDYPAIAKNVEFISHNEGGVTLLTAMSGCLDLPDKEYVMTELAGAWSRERHVKEREICYGIQGIYSMRGCSSHQFNPFLALKRKNADEHSGEVLGFSLVYSGDFLGQVEVDNFDVTRVIMGIHPNEFRWKLNGGESFQTPELVMMYSDEGMNGLSRSYHRLYRTRLARGMWRDKTRPILINNWEATYFDFNEEKILKIAKRAAEAGIELFVLDDGWFGRRNSDNVSLGDWYPNFEKLPGGIKGLAEKIRNMGMEFGLWIEPEMTNKDSDLFRAHPDWLLADIRRNYCHSRNQYVLDFSKKEVVDYIYGQLSRILAETPISYIKWDMNRSFSEVFSNGNDREYQGKVRHKYILGVYSLYERLIQRFPHILFESCASGGARFDPGMLYYAPQAWTSDNTDAVDRIKIQYGTSYVYPVGSMGSHVSASPNHQIFRSTTLATRANVAYFGTFGYELDITALDKEELDVIKKQVAFMKQHRELIQKGEFFRLKSPFEGNTAAWLSVSEKKDEALMGYYRILEPAQGKLERVYMKGLEKDTLYEVQECFGTERNWGVYGGDELMYAGFSVSDSSSGISDIASEFQGDFFSRLFYLKKRQ